jgi:hypothetical protein
MLRLKAQKLRTDENVKITAWSEAFGAQILITKIYQKGYHILTGTVPFCIH